MHSLKKIFFAGKLICISCLGSQTIKKDVQILTCYLSCRAKEATLSQRPLLGSISTLINLGADGF